MVCLLKCTLPYSSKLFLCHRIYLLHHKNRIYRIQNTISKQNPEGFAVEYEIFLSLSELYIDWKARVPNNTRQRSPPKYLQMKENKIE